MFAARNPQLSPSPLVLGVGAGKASATSPLSFSETVPPTTSMSLLIGVYTSTTASPSITMKIGTTSGTLVGSPLSYTGANPFYYIACYKILWSSGPPSGSQSSAMTLSTMVAGYFTTLHLQNATTAGTPITGIAAAAAQPSQTITSPTNPLTRYIQILSFRASASAQGFTVSNQYQNVRSVVPSVAALNPPMLISDAVGNNSGLVLSATRGNTTNPCGEFTVPISA